MAAWRRYLRANSSSAEEEGLLAAKMVGRWPSGAPLEPAPEHDDPELAADPHRVNDFLYREHDDRGFRCPAGAHIRRTNSRDVTIVGDARMPSRPYTVGRCTTIMAASSSRCPPT
ncbi:hypothetical protein [Streptomyces sp. SID1328]|uniref:hypothetical protein n=1 Tax=Streptomyces sp. SID1328 TaxID=2690250 RepID=UPI0019266D46|nr:hypothetical protein [Streptomyces sp. SID1328]